MESHIPSSTHLEEEEGYEDADQSAVLDQDLLAQTGVRRQLLDRKHLLAAQLLTCRCGVWAYLVWELGRTWFG